MNRPLEVCILAAGLGKRLKSNRPKVLQTIAGRPLLAHLLDSVAPLTPRRIHVVVGAGADAVKSAFTGSDVGFVMQSEQLGTGHAVMQALPAVGVDARLLILLGDAPLVQTATLSRLAAVDAPLGVLTVDQDNPFGYGRIIRESDGLIASIVEERDASDAQRQITEINTGVMAADAERLGAWLDQTSRDNDQGEYLLTDIVRIARASGEAVVAVKTDDPGEVQGVNTMAQLARLEREYQRRAAQQLMENGVQLMDPDRIDVRGSLATGAGCRIDVNCVFEGDCAIGDNAQIGPNCTLRNVRLGSNVIVGPGSVLDDVSVADGDRLAPMSLLQALDQSDESD